MVVWSSLRSALLRNVNNSKGIRLMSGDHHRTLPFQPSRFQWKKFKDMFHFYLMVGIIPATLIILYANIFIGPATLTEIPEGYVPKHWEYYRHPITRAMARYITPSPQQEYEKFLHHVYEEEEKRRIRRVENRVKELMSQRSDYQAYYYKPFSGKYHRMTKETADALKEMRGD